MRINFLLLSLGVLLSSIIGAEIKAEEPKKDTLTIEELVKNPSIHKGEIEIVGVVSIVYPKDSAFRIVSLKEYKECGIVCEDAPSIPVIYKDKLPKEKDEVWIRGVVEKVKKKGFVLKAKAYKKLAARREVKVN